MNINLFSKDYTVNNSVTTGNTIKLKGDGFGVGCVASVEVKHGTDEKLFIYGNIGNVELDQEVENLDIFLQKNWEVLKNAVENRQKED
jgi:hypothetical protein